MSYSLVLWFADLVLAEHVSTGGNMTATVFAPTSFLDGTNQPSLPKPIVPLATVQATNPSKRSKPFRFIHFIAPRGWDEVDIPQDTQNLVLGIPGFMCTQEAMRAMKTGLTTDETLYVDWGPVLNLGFTKPITKFLADYADYLAQKFGDKIILHGNSLGGFGAFLVAHKHPEIVERLFLTASPHMLTMDPADLREHTNIAPFLGLMRSRVLGRLCDQQMMNDWEQYRKHLGTAAAQELEVILDNLEIVFFAATRDSTVAGKMCVTSDAPNRRSFAIDGDHSDVGKAAMPAMKFLLDKPLHTELPDELLGLYLPIDAIEDLVRRTAEQVGRAFMDSSVPYRKAVEIYRGVSNVPTQLRNRERDPAPVASLAPSEAGYALERPALGICVN